MADDAPQGQVEIEGLLKQAQDEAAGAGDAEDAAATAVPASGDALGKDQVESPAEAVSTVASASPAVATTMAGAKPRAAAADDARIASDDMELLLQQAEAAIASVNDPSTAPVGVTPFRLRDFAGASPSSERSTLELIRDVELDLKIELGRTHMPLEEVLKLRKGSVVPLEKLAGDPVDVFVNGRLIARGEVLVLNDNFCVRVTELVASEAVA